MNIQKVKFKCPLEYREYKDILNNVKRGVLQSHNGDGYVCMTKDDTIYLVHFFEKGDIYMDNCRTNTEDTYYLTNDIPEEWHEAPEPVCRINVNSWQDLQLVVNMMKQLQESETSVEI